MWQFVYLHGLSFQGSPPLVALLWSYAGRSVLDVRITFDSDVLGNFGHVVGSVYVLLASHQKAPGGESN